MNNLEKIIKSKKTVFSIWDLQKILNTDQEDSIRNYVSKLWKRGVLQKLYYWIRWLSQYDPLELACKIKKNSYISLETPLKQSSIIFQNYGNNIFLVSDNTGEKTTNERKISYSKIKNTILQNPLGIIHYQGYAIACPERAICDRIYLSPNYYFDNIENIDFTKLEEISQIYNKRVILEIKKLIQNARHRST